ncbi:protein KRI1 homolog [Schistocerca gregaria]|uniref:protein KRI1 homolog n=1 Tax=Schistocerca gregaria TaxID=7010 RepID=UPI00211F08D6|nr:protein KRI1 homolog [Schistocerca gregaria]XP_049848657.1 protein KRI1 homolog [Schistocerca gregaria]
MSSIKQKDNVKTEKRKRGMDKERHRDKRSEVVDGASADRSQEEENRRKKSQKKRDQSEHEYKHKVRLLNEPTETNTYIQLALELQKKREQGLLDNVKDEQEEFVESESDTTEDSDGEMAIGISGQFFKVLSKINTKHPDIYDREKVFFPEVDGEKPNTDEEGAAEGSSENKVVPSDIQCEGDRGTETYVEQQEKIKKELLEAAWKNEEADEELLLLKSSESRLNSNVLEDDLEANQSVLADKKNECTDQLSKPADLKKDVGQVDENEQFLRDYILQKKWIGKGQEMFDEEMENQDYEAVEKQDDFERVYNFRFEEANGNRIITYPRNIVSARIEKKRRKEARKRQRERKQSKKEKLEQEKINMKRAKKKEIIEQVIELKRELADLSKADFKDDCEDWDPEEHDRVMGELFDNQEHSEKSGKKVKKPIFQDDIYSIEKLQHAKSWMELCRQISSKVQNPKSEKINQAIEEYENLDYEDMLGDEPVKFAYIQVPAINYGLTSEQILTMDDKTLQKIIPMKKLAPYREDHRKHKKKTQTASK